MNSQNKVNDSKLLSKSLSSLQINNTRTNGNNSQDSIIIYDSDDDDNKDGDDDATCNGINFVSPNVTTNTTDSIMTVETVNAKDNYVTNSIVDLVPSVLTSNIASVEHPNLDNTIHKYSKSKLSKATSPTPNIDCTDTIIAIDSTVHGNKDVDVTNQTKKIDVADNLLSGVDISFQYRWHMFRERFNASG